jgi:hypothetical protein
LFLALFVISPSDGYIYYPTGLDFAIRYSPASLSVISVVALVEDKKNGCTNHPMRQDRANRSRRHRRPQARIRRFAKDFFPFLAYPFLSHTHIHIESKSEAQLLKPNYIVIHFILTPEAGASQIPSILAGEQTPPPSDSALGSKDYSRPPIAIVMGGGYDDAGMELMRNASKGNTNSRPVPWLRADLTKPAPPLGPEYGKAMVARVKEVLARLESEGKLGEDEVYWY